MTTLSELAESVSVRAAEVSRLLREAELPEPTFNESSAHDFDSRQHASANSDALREARNALVNAAQELTQITMGPVDYLCSLSWFVAIRELQDFARLD
jgi:6-hydroxytryprostatin B O-methyltransferase